MLQEDVHGAGNTSVPSIAVSEVTVAEPSAHACLALVEEVAVGAAVEEGAPGRCHSAAAMADS
jgi:hypothetical protein